MYSSRYVLGLKQGLLFLISLILPNSNLVYFSECLDFPPIIPQFHRACTLCICFSFFIGPHALSCLRSQPWDLVDGNKPIQGIWAVRSFSFPSPAHFRCTLRFGFIHFPATERMSITTLTKAFFKPIRRLYTRQIVWEGCSFCLCAFCFPHGLTVPLFILVSRYWIVEASF